LKAFPTPKPSKSLTLTATSPPFVSGGIAEAGRRISRPPYFSAIGAALSTNSFWSLGFFLLANPFGVRSLSELLFGVWIFLGFGISPAGPAKFRFDLCAVPD